MTNSKKAKGDRAERDVQALLRELLGIPSIRRSLGAGRQDDVGDIDGVPHTALQVAHWTDILAAIRTKIVEVEEQRKRRRVPFASSFIKTRKGWIVVQSPEQWARMLRYALVGWKVTRQARQTAARDDRRATVRR